MQPVQDLTIEDRVSRTQYQFTLEIADADELSRVGAAAGRAAAAAAAARRRRERPAGPGPAGVRRHRPRHRAAASASRRRPIDNALYDAFGQRLVSTIFTQTNQYRVVLEVKPEFQRGPGALDDIYVTSTCRAGGAAGAAARPSRASSERDAPLAINHIGQFPAATISFNLAPGASLGEAVEAIERRETELGLPGSIDDQLPGRGARLPGVARPTSCCLILAAIVTMYIVLGVLYESYIHPITILSTLPSAGVGALLALMLAGTDLGDHRDHRHHPADRHRQEERDHDDRLRARRRAQRGQAAARGDLPGVPAALPADPDDDDGGAAGRAAADARHAASARSCAIRSASRSSAGCSVSQVLTLFTTPVIYLAFDRIARAARSREAAGSRLEPQRVSRRPRCAHEPLARRSSAAPSRRRC